MNKEILLKRITEIVEGQNLLFIDSIIRGDNRTRIIEIFIDGEIGITSEICKEVSSLIKVKIEEENLIESNFRLDVSSPGAERPLKFLKQYNKHLNRSFDLLYMAEKEEKSKKIKLTGINDNILTFNDGKNEIQIRFEEIKSAKVIISF
jgi:ribosome maturation factor RimP